MRDKSGNVRIGSNRYIDVKARNKQFSLHKGGDLTELQGSINRIGGLPDLDSRAIRHQSYRAPVEKEPSNYKPVPKVLIADPQVDARMLRSASMPSKKLNNLRFEL
jgi:hypothetical protein